MIPPEIILERYVKAGNFPQGYVGKLDIEQVASPAFRAFLEGLQAETNEALAIENANASGGVVHPPIHFDFLDSTFTNAHAIPLDDYWFIVLTLPLVISVSETAKTLSRSQSVLQLLNLNTKEMQHTDILWSFLGQILMLFLTAHEYTHLVHKHKAGTALSEMWTEFVIPDEQGSIDSQAEELNADAYSAYLNLAFLLRSERRERALVQLGRDKLPSRDADELIVSCYLLVLMGFFRTRWPMDVSTPLDQSSHPPVPVRIDYLIQTVGMWCGQFDVLDKPWFTSPKMTALFRAAATGGNEVNQKGWDVQVAFLTSPSGDLYRNLVFEKAEKLRKQK